MCRLQPGAPIPAWAAINAPASLLSITRTHDELSIVCPEKDVPAAITAEGDPRAERGWAGLRVAGVLEFSLTGVIAQLTETLAAVGITVLTLATYDTDYILVRHESLERAARALRLEGHIVEGL